MKICLKLSDDTEKRRIFRTLDITAYSNKVRLKLSDCDRVIEVNRDELLYAISFKPEKAQEK